MSKKGVTRGLDKLGRVVIPMSMRKLLNIGSDDTLEVHTEGNKIILEKYEPFCVFCGSENDLTDYEGKKICKACIDKIKEL